MHSSDLDKIESSKVREYIEMLEEMAENLESKPLEKIHEALSLLLDRVEELEGEAEDHESEMTEKDEEISNLESKIEELELEQEIEEFREAQEEVDVSDFTLVTLDKISAAERRDKTLEFDGPWISDEMQWHRESDKAEIVVFLPNNQYLCHRHLRRASRGD